MQFPQVKTGIGVGMAQLLDTTQFTQQIIQLNERNRQRQAQEEQKLSEMLSKHMPDGIRLADQGTFMEAYKEYKNLYLSNKELYTQPSKHPEQFRKAQDLEAKMKLIAEKSKSLKATLNDTAKEVAKHRSLYDNTIVDRLTKWDSLPLEQIELENNGRLPTALDFQTKPTPPDFDKISNRVQSFGMFEDRPVVIKGDNKNGVQQGEILSRVDRINKPEAIRLAAIELFAENGEEARFYRHAFKDVKPEVKQRLQSQVDTILGPGAIDVNESPESFAEADLLLKNYTIPGKAEIRKDIAFENQKSLEKDRLNFNQSLQLESIRHKHDLDGRKFTAEQQRQRDLERERRSQGDVNQLAADVEAIQKSLVNGSIREWRDRVKPLFQAGTKYGKEPRFLVPDKAKNLKDFQRQVELFNGQVKSFSNGQYEVNEEDAKELYDKRVPLLIITRKDAKGDMPVLLLNPLKKSFSGLMAAELKFATGATRKTGAGFSEDEPTEIE